MFRKFLLFQKFCRNLVSELSSERKKFLKVFFMMLLNLRESKSQKNGKQKLHVCACVCVGGGGEVLRKVPKHFSGSRFRKIFQ